MVYIDIIVLSAHFIQLHLVIYSMVLSRNCHENPWMQFHAVFIELLHKKMDRQEI